MSIQVGQDIAKALANIEVTKEMLKLLSPNIDCSVLEEWHRAAVVEEVAAIMQLHGVKASAKDVGALLADGAGTGRLNVGQRKILAYANALQTVLQHADDILFNEETFKALHKQLMEDEDCAGVAGEYKTQPNGLSGFGDQSDKDFQTAAPHEIPKLMKGLINWVRNALKEGGHPLIVTLVFANMFLAFSPFQAGNDRLCRLLVTLLLLKLGYGFIQYGAMTMFFVQDLDKLHRVFMMTQADLKAMKWEWMPWMRVALKPITACAGELRQRLELHHAENVEAENARDAVALPELSARILEFVRRNGQAAMNAVMLETGISRHTLKGHLSRLVKRGQLVRRGSGRGAWYSLS